MKAIILAAGYATRLYPLTENMPKALLPIGKRRMLDYLVDEIAGLNGMSEIHIVTNHRFAEQFEAWKTECVPRYPGIRFIVWDDGTTDNSNRLGAVGDIKFVLDHADIDDDVLIAASDNFFTFPLQLFVDEFHAQKRDMLLAARFDDIRTLRSFAVATLDENGRVETLVEKPDEPKSNIGVYALYMYSKDTVSLVDEYIRGGNNPDSPGRFPEWLCRRGHEMGVYIFDGECIDIGTIENYEEVRRRFGEEK